MKRLIYACLVCALSISSTAHAATLRTVALSGQQAPGTPSGVNYSGFFTPVLNDAGQTAFGANLAGSGVDITNDQGMWSEGSGSLALVARSGSQAPGTPSGVNYSQFVRSPALNDAGQTAFYARLTGNGVDFTNEQSILSEGSGSLALVARGGNPAPGTPSGVNYSEVNSPALNDAGQTAFYATLTGGGVIFLNNDQGVWAQRSGNLALVARSGSPAPGTLDGVNFRGLSNSPVLNNASQTAFQASLTGSGVDSTNNQGIWSEGSGSLALVARTGNQAPGTPSGVNYSSFSVAPVLNDAGQTAFQGGLTGTGVDSTNNLGIWSEGAGSLALVARKGSQAPGTPSGVNFSSFFSVAPTLNDAGQTAFAAGLTGSGVDSTNNSGIWSEGSGSLALVARGGSQAPGTPSGVNFSSFINTALNDAGQIAFSAFLAGSGVDNTNNIGIWATDRTGVLQLIDRSSDLLKVTVGDFSPSGFNNLGQLAFRASFTDGSSGIFDSDAVAVPEPSSLVLSALAAAGLLWRTRVSKGEGRRRTLIFSNRRSSGLAEISAN